MSLVRDDSEDNVAKVETLDDVTLRALRGIRDWFSRRHRPIVDPEVKKAVGRVWSETWTGKRTVDTNRKNKRL